MSFEFRRKVREVGMTLVVGIVIGKKAHWIQWGTSKGREFGHQEGPQVAFPLVISPWSGAGLWLGSPEA